MRTEVTRDGEKFTMKNFPSSIKVIKPECLGCCSMLITCDRHEK